MARIGRLLALSCIVLICACDTSSGGPPGLNPNPPSSVAPITLTPSSLALSGTGAANARNVTVSEAGYTGTFSADPAPCAGVATAVLSADTRTLTVTPVAPGSCSLSVRDTIGNATALPVRVNP